MSKAYDVLRKRRFNNIQDEKKLQSEIAEAFLKENLIFEREKIVDKINIFDFFIDGEVIEVKIKGRKREIYYQLVRYAELECCKSIILITNVAIGLPKEINNKPVSIIKLSTAWL